MFRVPTPTPRLTLFPVTFTRTWWFENWRNLIWKPLYPSLVEHVLLAAGEANQSEEEPEIVTDEDENRKTTAETLKKLHEVKNFIQVNERDHLTMIFNELIKNVEQIKLKNQKQSNVRSFFTSQNIFYLYCFLVSYEKILNHNFCCLFLPKRSRTLYSGMLVIADT